MKNITKKVWPPMCGANPCGRFLAEVREDGWIMAHAYFNTQQEGEAWLETQSGEMDKRTAKVYADVISNHGT